MEERLQKFLANAGVASRRQCEQYILDGKVKVNGKIVRELGTKVTQKDEVMYNGKIIKHIQKEEYVYIMLNKPLGFVTTVSDEKGRKTVLDLVKVDKRVVPVGRLDMYTSGLLLLTNDGDLVYELTHPKHEISKTYEVSIDKNITKEELEILKNPMNIDGYITKGADVQILKQHPEKVILHITIAEGRNRQVRKMIEQIGHRVLYLKRISIGKLTMNDLGLGKWRYLTKTDVKKIYK